MSTQEVAALLGVSDRSVRNLINEGRLGAVACPAPSGWYIDRSALLGLDYHKGKHYQPAVDKSPEVRYRRLYLTGSKDDVLRFCKGAKQETGAPARHSKSQDRKGFWISLHADDATVDALVAQWQAQGGAIKPFPYYVANGVGSDGRFMGTAGFNPDPRLIALCRERVKGGYCALRDDPDLLD